MTFMMCLVVQGQTNVDVLAVIVPVDGSAIQGEGKTFRYRMQYRVFYLFSLEEKSAIVSDFLLQITMREQFLHR